MLLTSFQKLVVEMSTSKVKIGIQKDKLHYAIANQDWKTAKEIKEELKGFIDVNLDGYGERGSGKTSGTIEAATMAGLVALYINPAQWVDAADAVGMPKVIEINGKPVTKNVVRDFFPQLKLNDKGERILRKDGGYMIDFESIKDYIANYEDLLIMYEGDINQVPGLVVIWDEFNRIVAADVQQMMYSVMLNHEIGDYAFPNSSFFVALTNPNTADYSVSPIMEEEAMKDRFCHVPVENSLEIFNGYMKRNKFHWSVISLANEHPETVKPTGEDYDLNVKPSNRAMEMLSSVLTFTNIEEELENGDFQEVVAGLLGNTYAARHNDILEKGEAEKVPTGEEIITAYEDVRQIVIGASEQNRQDILTIVKENFLEIITQEDTIEKYNLRAKKDMDNNVIIPPNLDNIYKFFTDIPAEYRVAMVKMFVNMPKLHPVIALHQNLYDLVKNDISRSRKSK